MSTPQATKCRIRSFSLDGVNVLQYVNRLFVYETICKPYITVKMIMVDTANILINLKIFDASSRMIRPVKCTFAFDAGFGLVYDCTVYLLSIDGMQDSKSHRAQVYTLNFVGPQYYQDKSNIVQQAFKSIPGTQVIQKIHQQYLSGGLKVLAQSLGPISKEQSHIVSSKNPIAAIRDVQKRLSYGQYKSGSTVYFHDKNGLNLGPLEGYFAQLSAQEQFIQKTTWGADFVKDAAESYHSIMAVRVDAKEGSFASGASGAASASQEKNVFDFLTKKATKKMTGSVASGIGQLSNFVGLFGSVGGHGGFPNYHVMDGSRTDSGTDPSVKTERERVLHAVTVDGPTISIKVPIQTGINCTVGKGIFAKLLPAIGDVKTSKYSEIGGLMMVVDLSHEIAVDDTTTQGTTTMKCAKGK